MTMRRIDRALTFTTSPSRRIHMFAPVARLLRQPIRCFRAAGLILLASCGGAEPAGHPLAVAHRVEFEPIAEMSGIVRGPAHSLGGPSGDALFWVHNDSGDEPRLFPLDAQARVRIPADLADEYRGEASRLGAGADASTNVWPSMVWPGVRIENAENNDWEDVASDGTHLYIADLGNNLNTRQNLGIYAVPWESLGNGNGRTATASRYIPVHYPEQADFPPLDRHFDSESLFFADGKLYAITKHREPFPSQRMQPGANLYRLDSQSETESNPLILIDHHPDLTAATAAELAPDGETLAVLSYTAIWLFERPQSGDAWLSSPSRQLPLDPEAARQVEAIAWLDGETLIATNEQRDWFEVPLSLFAP